MARKQRFTLDEQGFLRNKRGETLGRVFSITLEVYGGGPTGGSPSSGDLVGSPSSLAKAEVERRENAVEGQTPLERVEREPEAPQTSPETPKTLPGMDEGLALYEAWLRIFERDAQKLRFGPSRKRAAKRALSEASLETCVKALEGARAFRKVKPGSEEFTDIFGTFRGTGDLASRIEFFADFASKPTAGFAADAELAGIPSAQRDMVRERQRHVVAMLRAPNDESLREQGKLAEEWLAETVGLYATVDGTTVRWNRSAGGGTDPAGAVRSGISYRRP